MPRHSKLPKELKESHNTASGSWVVFAGMLAAGVVFEKIQLLESKKRTIPLVGYFIVNNKKVYYVRFGLLNDPDVWQK